MSVPARVMTVLIGLLLTIVLVTYNQYGFTFDEYEGFIRAKAVFAVLSSGRVAGPSDIDMFHGAAPDVIALALQKVIPQLSYDSRHLVFALFGVAGIYYVYRFGSMFVSEWTGVFAALFLAATPMWFGYMFINHKDIPFATLLLAASYYSLLAITGQPTSSRFWVKAGLAIGLFAATKFVGLLLLVFVVAVYLASLAIFPAQKMLKVSPGLWWRLTRLGGVGVLGCLVAFLLFWPQFYFGDIAGPGGSHGGFMDSQQFSNWERKTDPYYAIRYFVITTPIFLLGFAAVGAVCAIYRQEASVLAAVIIFILSFLAAGMAGARVGNGCRHFLFVYPFFMLVAAYPVSLLFDGASGRLVRLAVASAIAIYVAVTAITMYRLFPYQYSFYNSLVGGLQGADGVYELDTWRSAHREAMDLIASKIAPGKTARVYSCASKIDYHRHRHLKLASKEEADYFVAQRQGRRNCVPSAFDGLPVVGEVRREGVLLARVYAAVR